MPDLTDPTNASKSTPNIPASSAKLHIGSSSIIAAPSSQVWAALVDTSTWPSWNAFVPRVTIRSQPDTPSPPELNASTPEGGEGRLSQVLRNGTRMTFHVQMNAFSAPTTTFTSTSPSDSASVSMAENGREVHLIVTDFLAPNPTTRTAGRIVWAADFDAPGTLAPSLLTAERVHEVVDVDLAVETADGDASETLRGTEVRTWEAQVGWLAHVVRWMYGNKLQRNFEMWVDGLREFVERKKSPQT